MPDMSSTAPVCPQTSVVERNTLWAIDIFETRTLLAAGIERKEPRLEILFAKAAIFIKWQYGLFC